MDADSQLPPEQNKAKMIFQIIPLTVGLILSFIGSTLSWSWAVAPWWYSLLCSTFTFSILAFLVVELKDDYQDRILFKMGHKSLKYLVALTIAGSFTQAVKDGDYSYLNFIVAFSILVMNYKTQRVLRSFEDLDTIDI